MKRSIASLVESTAELVVTFQFTEVDWVQHPPRRIRVKAQPSDVRPASRYRSEGLGAALAAMSAQAGGPLASHAQAKALSTPAISCAGIATA